MPVVESRCIVPVSVETAFAVSQTTGDIRMRWDPFIRRQYFLGGAPAPAKGVRTYTVQRLGFRMESEYVSYNPPSNVGMKMTKGSWFFERLAGGWRFSAAAGADAGTDAGTLAVWRYNFACKPRWLAPIAERVGAVILQRDIDRRIGGFARGCTDPVVLASVAAAQLPEP
ncbi:SRPBCC family protein [Cryobacterium sp. AP23]